MKFQDEQIMKNEEERYCYTIVQRRIRMGHGTELDYRFHSYEWSDGKIVYFGYEHLSSAVQRCPFSGEYITAKEYVERFKEQIDRYPLRELTFQELVDAFAYMSRKGTLDSDTRLELLWNIIHSFNDKYRRKENSPVPGQKEEIYFIDAVMEMQRYDNHNVPQSIKAELFREIRMFDRAYAIYDPFTAPNDKDEKEIMAEVMLRAARGDSTLFIIEDIPLYSSMLRQSKRKCCERYFPKASLKKI